MTSSKKLDAVRQSISNWCQTYQREEGSVSLIAVSKTRTADEVLELHRAGQNVFGENYLQESLERSLSEALEAERVAQLRCFASKDAREGLKAFLEKRKPFYGGE